MKQKATSVDLRGFIRQGAREEERDIPEDPRRCKKKSKSPKRIRKAKGYRYSESMVKDF